MEGHGVVGSGNSKAGGVWTTTFLCHSLDKCQTQAIPASCDFEHWYDWFRFNVVTQQYDLIGGNGANPDNYGNVACESSQAHTGSHKAQDNVAGYHKIVHTVDGTSVNRGYSSEDYDEVLYFD